MPKVMMELEGAAETGILCAIFAVGVAGISEPSADQLKEAPDAAHVH